MIEEAASHVAKRDGVETELVDIRELSISIHDAGEVIKHAGFSATVNRATGDRPLRMRVPTT
jgi:hypothetical protein